MLTEPRVKVIFKIVFPFNAFPLATDLISRLSAATKVLYERFRGNDDALPDGREGPGPSTTGMAPA